MFLEEIPDATIKKRKRKAKTYALKGVMTIVKGRQDVIKIHYEQLSPLSLNIWKKLIHLWKYPIVQN